MSNSESDAAARQGKLVVISGPSGTGKTSICNALLERLPKAKWSVSATTRPPRGKEVQGQAYEFISEEEFERRRAAKAFLETAEYVGHWYGTPREPVERALAVGQYVIMEIDVQGGIQVAREMPHAVLIFVLPPNRESLRARLEGRATEAEDQLRKRLAEADGEIAVARDSGAYNHFVVNDVLEDTIQEVMGIVAGAPAATTD
jgi:guanylate kinase